MALSRPFVLVTTTVLFLATGARAATVSGIVLDVGGKPIAGAKLAYVPLEFRSLLYGGGVTPGVVTTGADGRWTFQTQDDETSPLLSHYLDGRVCWARVIAPGYAIAEPLLVAGENKLTLSPAGTITGQVVNEKGHPVTGVSVEFVGQRLQSNTLALQSPPELPTISARTGDDGRFTISGLPAKGTSLLAIDDDQYQLEPVEVTGTETNLTLIAKSGYSISGRLLNPDGTTARELAVYARDPAQPQATQFAVSGEDGTFLITGLGPKAGTLMAPPQADSAFVFSALHYPQLKADDPNQQPDWKAATGVEVSGTVLTQADKKPVAGADIILGGESFQYAATDATGHFTMRTATGQSYLLVEGSGNTLGIQRPVQIGAGPTQDLGELDLPAGVFAKGVTEDETGHPLPGVHLTVVPDGNSFLPPATVSGADGSFQLGPLPSGKIALALPGNSPYDLVDSGQFSTPDVTGAKPSLEVKLRKAPLYDIAMRVVSPEGIPIPGARVTVVLHLASFAGDGSVRTELREASTDQDGEATVTGVRSNTAPTIGNVECPGHDTQSLGTAVLKDNTWTFSDTVLATHDKKLCGKIYTSDGHPAAGAHVSTLTVVGNQCLTAVTRADGSFELDGVPDGDAKYIAASGLESLISTAKPGSPVEWHLQPPAPVDPATRTAFFGGLGHNNFWALDGYAEYLGADKMLDLALRQDGAIKSDGATDPARVGGAFGDFLQGLAVHDAKDGASIGPGLLDKYDPDHKKVEWQISVAQCAVSADDAAATTWANAFIDSQRKVRPEMDATTDYAQRWFEMAGIANGLNRPDASYFTDVAFTMADDEGKKSTMQHAGQWAEALSFGGPEVLGRLQDEWGTVERFRGLCRSASNIARTDTKAALTLLDTVTALAKDPAVQAWDKDNATNQNSWEASPFQLSRATGDVADQLAQRDPAAALTLVPNADNWNVPGLYLKIARGAMKLGLPDLAAKAIQAELDCTNKIPDLDPYFAHLIAKSNPDLATSLQKAADDNNSRSYPGVDAYAVADYHFYNPKEDPALARIGLEVEWAAQQKAIDENSGDADQRRASQPALAAALFPIDPVRALELLSGATDTWSGKTSAKARITTMMVSDPATWRDIPPYGWNY